MGTTTATRDRFVPILWPLEISTIRRHETFRDALHEATNYGELIGGRRFRPYDCRRSYKVLLTHAKIPGNRVDHYMGHSSEDETGKKYAQLADLLPYINKDRDTVLAYIKEQLKEHQPVNPLASQFFELEDKPEASLITVADLF